MGTAILRSPNCLRDRFRHHETLTLALENFNPTSPNVSHNYRRRKRSPNSSDRRVGGGYNGSRSAQSQRTSTAVNFPAKRNNLVMGQVRILKRGETLKLKRNDDSDLFLGSTDRLGPDPETVQSQIRVKELKKTASAAAVVALEGEIYAGSSVFESPPPSSVPLPGFLGRMQPRVDGATASSDLRRLLRLE